VERFQGAQNSTDRDWAVRHARGAELLSASSASKYLQLADRLKRFRDVQLDSLELDQPAYEDVRLKAQSGELFPEATKAAFLSGGVTDEELSAIEQSISTSQVETLPVGNFESLRMSYSDKLRDGAHRLIEAMSQSAARL